MGRVIKLPFLPLWLEGVRRQVSGGTLFDIHTMPQNKWMDECRAAGQGRLLKFDYFHDVM